MLNPFLVVEGSSKVKKRWIHVVGGGQSGHEAVANIALRKKLGRDPTIQEFKKYTANMQTDAYAALAKELEVDIDQSFSKGEEVRFTLFSHPLN
jgi:lysine/ornithine N-monooxygenase